MYARRTAVLGLFVLLFIKPVFCADLTREAVQEILRRATAHRPADFSGKSLEKLDLSHLEFRGAKLAGANLYAARLEGADFSGADLTGANLNLAWVIRANFRGANLSDASLQGLVVSMGMETSAAEAPIFAGANLSRARIIARLSWGDLHGANFANAQMGADMKNQSMGLMRADLSKADLAGANFAGADLGHALLRFAKLRGANLRGARLVRADLSGADLTGADLTDADASEADFGAAVLKAVRGLDKLRGSPPMGLNP
jgi:uncharacterized protein YjbI with pentapeptide repeats